MTETATPPVVTETTTTIPPTTETSSPNISKAPSNAKPYDDEMLELYEQEYVEEEGNNETNNITKKEINDGTQKEEASEEGSQEQKPEKEEPKQEDAIEDTSIRKLINGKEVEFKVKDAIQAYVKQEEFNRNMDRRSTALGQKEAKWNKEVNEFKNSINTVVFESLRKGDIHTPIRTLAKMATLNTDLDPVDIERQLFASLDKTADLYNKASPEERERFFIQRSRDVALEKVKALEQERALIAEQEKMKTEVSAVLQKTGLPEEAFWATYESLVQNDVGNGKRFQSEQEIKPQDVVDTFQQEVALKTKAYRALQLAGIDEDLMVDDLSQIAAANPTWTEEDLLGIVKKAYRLDNIASPETVENLNRKAEKSRLRFNQGSSTKKENDKISGYDEDDLQFLNRHKPKTYVRPVR